MHKNGKNAAHQNHKKIFHKNKPKTVQKTNDTITILPGARLRGRVILPGDKSISQRALLFAALAKGETRITGLSDAADVRSMASCLRRLGVAIDTRGRTTWVAGNGLHGLRAPANELDCGNSGTAMRLLAGVLAGQPFVSMLTGDKSLSRRPMTRIITPLQQMGAKIEAADKGTAPLHIHGGRLHGIRYTLPVASAQVKSAVLLAGLFAEGETTVIEPVPTRDHTEIMLSWLGADFTKNGTHLTIRPSALTARPITVPGDFSAAAFFIVAGLLCEGSEIVMPGLGINPTRSAMLGVLAKSGAAILQDEPVDRNGELTATLTVRHGPLRAFELDGEQIPLLIDELPVLAVLATQAHGTTRIRGAAELRVKESDRIAVVVNNLRAMGAEVEEFPDGMEIPGPQRLRGAHIDAFDDHRIAMAFAIAGLVAVGETTIHGAGSAAVSFPEFFPTLKKLREDG